VKLGREGENILVERELRRGAKWGGGKGKVLGWKGAGVLLLALWAYLQMLGNQTESAVPESALASTSMDSSLTSISCLVEGV